MANDLLYSRIATAIHAAKMMGGGEPLRIYLTFETITQIMRNHAMPPGMMMRRFCGIPVSQPFPGDPGERVIDRNGKAYFIA